MATTAKAKPMDPDDLIDMPGGAKMLFVTRKTIANWLTQGKLSRFKVGRRTLVSKSELLGLIRKAV